MNHTELNVVAGLVAEQVIATIRSEKSLDRWMTVPEAMAYAKVKSRTTIMEWLDRGFIYGMKRDGGSWIIDRETIDDWYNSER